MANVDPSIDQQTSSDAGGFRLRLTNWQIILILLVVIGGRMVIDFSQRIIDGQQKLVEQRELEAELAALRAERKALESARLYYSSQAFIEAWAHNEGKMVREGEKLVIPVYQGTITTAEVNNVSEPEQTAIQPAPPAWQVWWTLFFDEPPPINQP